MSVSLALKKEGVGLQPDSARVLICGGLGRLAHMRARKTRPSYVHPEFIIDREAERYISRHLQIYLSM